MSRLVPLLDESRPLVMGILNVTPDSFSDGGKFLSPSAAIEHANRMIRDGVDIIDVGGESTRPGALAVSSEEEMARVMPVIEAIREPSEICISIDTSSPEVMLESSRLGADIINDVRAMRRSGAVEAAASTGLPVCLMHMKGEPGTMQAAPFYEDILREINDFFLERIAACSKAGISSDRLVLDPGFGFGKKPEHNLQLINKLGCFKEHGMPLLVGLSRKSTIARITDNGLVGSVTGALLAVARGANIIRVHDVAETVSALSVASAINAESLEAEL